ncbi:hypothetical protein APHAL10511_005410 [Amanita phalloides]|nr:hypothetical protein APHAL10511_005410 [Amanita phalloides]
MPGTSTQRFAARVKAMTMKYRNEPFEYAKGNMVPGMTKDKACISTDLLQHRAREDGSYDEEEILKDAIANIYLAGVETIICAKVIFFIAMALHPAAQNKAQEEIDRVVGPHRLVTFKDRTSLLYVEALYREVLRWRPVAPLGFPHSTIRDEVYQGYHIPKGCFVIANIWAMTRDEATYPEPEAFRPERFFLQSGLLNDDDMGYVFGFGRRICPGRYMADSVLWLMMASVLSTFNIAKAKNGNGTDIDIDLDAFSDTVVSQPPSFQCSILPRSEQAAERVHALLES